MPMEPTPGGVRRLAAGLDRFVRNLTNGEYQLLDSHEGEIPESLLEEARVLLSCLQLSSDGIAQAVAAREIQRARTLAHDDASGRVTATCVLYAIERYLAGLPPDVVQDPREERKRRSPRD